MRVPGSVVNGNDLFGERKSGYGNPAERSTRESEDGEGGHQKIPISNCDRGLLGLSDRGSGHPGGILGERGAGSDRGEEGCDQGVQDSGQTVSHLGERVTEKHRENLLGPRASQVKQERHLKSEYPQDLSLDCGHPEFLGHNAHGAPEIQAPVRFQFRGPKGKKTRSHRAKQTRCNPAKDSNSPTERRLRGPKKGKIRPQREMLSCGPIVERSGGHKAEARRCSREEQCEGATEGCPIRDVEVDCQLAFTDDFCSRCLGAQVHGEESLTDKGDCTLLVSQLGEPFGTAYCGFQTTLYRNPVYNYCHMHVGGTGLDFGDAMARNPVCACERGDVTVMGCLCDSGVVSASRPVFDFKDRDITCDVGSWTVGYSGCELEDVDVRVLEWKFGPPVKDSVLKDFGFDSRAVTLCHCEDVAVSCPRCRNRATDVATSGHRCRENACWGSGCDTDIIVDSGFESGVMGVKLECYVGAESPVSKDKDARVEIAECDGFEVCVSSCGYQSGDMANCGPVKELAALGGVGCHHKKGSCKDLECQRESLLRTFLRHTHRKGCGEKFDDVSERSLGGNLEDQRGGWSMALGDKNVSASCPGSEYKDDVDGCSRDKCKVNCRSGTSGEPQTMSVCGSGSQYRVGEFDFQDPCGRSPVVGCSDACRGSPGSEYHGSCAKTLVDEYQDFCVKTSDGVYGEVAAKVSEDESLPTELRDPRGETCTVIYQYSTFEYVENVIVHPELEHNSVSASGFAFREACDKSLGCKETGCPDVPSSGMKSNSGAPGSHDGEDAKWICSIGECRNAEFTVPSCMYRDAEYLDTSWDYEDMGDESGDAWWLCPSGGYDNSWWTCPKGLYIDPGCWCPRNDFESSECWCPGDVEVVSPGEVGCWLSAEEYRYTGGGGDPCNFMSRGHPRGLQGCGVARTTEETDIGLLKVASSERILTLDYAATGECNTGWWEEGLGDSPFDTHSDDGDSSAQNEVKSSCTVGLCSDLTDLDLVTTARVCSETPPVALEVEARSGPPSGSDGEGALQELGTATSENLEPLVGCGRLLGTEVVWLEREEEQGQSRLQVLGDLSVSPSKAEDIWVPRRWPKAVLGCGQISVNPKGKQQSRQVADVWVPREKNSRKVWHDWAQRKKGDEVTASVLSDKSLAGAKEVQLQKEKDAVHTWDMWVRRSRARKCALAVSCERDGGVDCLGGQAPLKDRHRGHDSLCLKGGS
ncbi:hypothetical protein NDU88_003546 [Pleurodeles waltl]|uniref:Uncharacterized protein n=1 Tax=Pleurodeles waltl TaxID=8319 RepID=A0AAV7MVX1_PLEWA|nr:hypothetical protein NDU88_003546 [Pleurodeles waltl]